MQLTREGSSTRMTEPAYAVPMISHSATFVKATFGEKRGPQQ